MVSSSIHLSDMEKWLMAFEHYNHSQFDRAIDVFNTMSETSKIVFNCGIIRANAGQHGPAISYCKKATSLDNYLAVAYFQQGISQFTLGAFKDAYDAFSSSLKSLRELQYINYTQLGLDFTLYSCEIRFNRGLCQIKLQQIEAGLSELKLAAREKVTKAHDVIDKAIKRDTMEHKVFCIPYGVIFRPSEAKTKSLQASCTSASATLFSRSAKELDLVHRKQLLPSQRATNDKSADKVYYPTLKLIQSATLLDQDTLPATPLSTNDSTVISQLTSRATSDESMSGFISSPSSGSIQTGCVTPNGTRKSSSSLLSDRTELDYSSICRASILSSMVIKAHYGNETKNIFISSQATVETLMDKLSSKFKIKIKGGFRVRYRDYKGDMVLLNSQENLDEAINLAEKTVTKEGVSVRELELCMERHQPRVFSRSMYS